MFLKSFILLSPANRRLILALILTHVLWCGLTFGILLVSGMFEKTSFWWSSAFMVVQLYAAAQIFLPALLLQPEKRNRGFYLFWGILLALSVWSLNQFSPEGTGLSLLSVLKSGLLLLVATLVGTVLARYVQRLWELVPICIMMTLADFSSWLVGPTAGFSQQIEQYYLHPVGAPPLIDMVLIKLASPGALGLIPVFGISDWIMVVFFAGVAARFRVNDNLLGIFGKALEPLRRSGLYLPISVAALYAAILLAQVTGFFVPALPLIALIMLLWYAGRYLVLRQAG